MQINNELVLIMDFGGQYSQLIARRVREQNVYCEIKSYKISASEIKEKGYKGIIFSGGPNSVYSKDAPKCDCKIFECGIPILGICYGAQIMAHSLNGVVSSSTVNEFGKTNVKYDNCSVIFEDIIPKGICWMSHTDYISQVPQGFKIVAKSKDCPVAAMENSERNLYAMQFHPEVQQTEKGNKMIENFLYNVCCCKGDWKMSSYITKTVERLKKEIGDKKVLCGLSGGVDSSVAAMLVHKAIGKNLTCVFVDNGLLRKNEGNEVESVFLKQFDMNLIRVNAKDRFLSKLCGVSDPEQKRKIIGNEFINIFVDEAKKIGNVDYLCQGTIYPDIIESGIGDSAVIKSHHNVGGLPKEIGFNGLIEPLRNLFKDEVRKVGLELGIPDFLVLRQPFPGPGLAVRIIGEVTEEKLKILQDADAIFREEIMGAGLNKDINQYFAVLTGTKSVGVMGDSRTYSNTIALRAVETSDFMTGNWAKIPYDLLGIISSRIINEVASVNRVVYDITSKPPATIEWE